MTSKSSIVTGLMLGLATGIALGTYVLGPNLPGGSNQENTNAIALLDKAREEAATNEAQMKTVDNYIASISEGVVDGRLVDRSVVVITTSDADSEDIGHVEWLLMRAGAIPAGTIKLEKKFLDQDAADSLKRVVTETLPAGAQLSETSLDPGTHAGEALGYALSVVNAQPAATDEDRKAIVAALKDAGFIDYKEENPIGPARGAVLILGDDDGTKNSFGAMTTASFAQGLDSQGVGVVVSGRIHSADKSGVIGRIRETPDGRDNVSTVDSVNRSFGRMGTVLAVVEQLQGGSGAYGAANNADAAAPPLPPR
ncbi:MAG: copper transporter [Corynebacterium sp.]|nr:copper transporter [Corynebacterium sp.]